MPNLRVNIEEDPRGPIVRIDGNIDMLAAELLRDRLTPLCARRPSRVVLDMAGVSFIGSLGLGTLVMVGRTIDRCGGKLKLAAVPPQVWDVFKRAQLEPLFEAHPSVEAALSDAAAPSA